MLLKVSYIFCIIFSLWTSASANTPIAEGFWTDRMPANSSYKMNNITISDEGIKEYGYDRFDHKTEIVAIGKFGVNSRDGQGLAVNQVRLHYLTSSEGKIYQGKVRPDYLQLDQTIYEPELTITMNIKKDVDSTVVTVIDCGQQHIPDCPAKLYYDINGFEVA